MTTSTKTRTPESMMTNTITSMAHASPPAESASTHNAIERSDNDPFDIREQLSHAPRPCPNETSNIVEFYSGRSVFITGASGFLGKVLIEKLLRTCPSIRRVFVLIRPKYNKQPHERLKELLASHLYDGVREQQHQQDGQKRDQQQLEDKVCLVEGDITQPNLGLSSQNLARITKEVSVIFHSAATVKFDEPLKQSVAINILGTKNMINVCRRCAQLVSLVHVSTAYANCDREQIDEHVYPVDMDPERLIELADWMDQESLQTLKARFLGAKPNTYTYTKSLAEWLVMRSGRDLPVVICRPSIVVATANEPFKGWIDNMNGPTGVILGTGKGLIRTMYAERDFVADLVPADKVINLIVALGWFAHLKRRLLDADDEEAGLISESDLLLTVGSSECSSPGSGSSAASTSGIDDSMQEEEVELGDGGERDHLSAVASNQQQHRMLDHHRYLHVHARRHHHKRGAAGLAETASLLPSEATGNSCSSSAEDESGGELSLSSEYEPNQMLGDEDGAKAVSLISDLEQQPDDAGYSSRSPEYANSLASSSDMAERSKPRRRSSAGTKQQQQQQQHRHHHHRHHIHDHNLHQEDGKCALEGLGEQQQLIVATNNNSENMAHPQETRAKLRKLRQSIVAKLNEKGLPEELADVPVFHCTSGKENPLTWGQVQVFILAALSVFPSSATFRYPCGSFTNNVLLDKFYAITLHYLPAYVFDFITRLTGGKPILVKIFNKFHQATEVLKAFTSKQWQFGNENRLFLLEELMNDEDRRLFNCDIRAIDWRQFLEDYVIGVRKFLLKEPMSNLAEARRNLRFVYLRNLCLQLALATSGAYYVLSSVGLI